MDGLLIFDHHNDIIYKKINNELSEKIRQIALSQELITSESPAEEHLNNNIVLQIFSPIINSQKIMFCQFDNTYTTFQCDNDVNFAFDEFLGYMFVRIKSGPIDKLRRSLGICLSFARYICGTNLFILKSKESKVELFTDLLDTWEELYDSEQGFLLEAIDQVLINVDVKNAISKTLEAATDKLKQDPHSQRSYALLYVNGRFLGLYSSRQAQKLSPSDILFLTILCKNLQSKMSSKAINIQSHLFFLRGQTSTGFSGCVPHIVHHSILDKGVVLILLIEYGNLPVASSLFDTFFALQKTRHIQMQGDFENLKSSFETLETYVKQTIEAFKKAKYNSMDIDSCFKRFCSKWELLKKKYQEFFKSSEKSLVIRIESNVPAFADELKELFSLTCLECAALEHGFERVSEISTLVEERLLEFTEFLSVKSQRNLSIESYFSCMFFQSFKLKHMLDSLQWLSVRQRITMNVFMFIYKAKCNLMPKYLTIYINLVKDMQPYLEEFPGLVHFMYIDRTVGFMVAPDVSCNSTLIPKEKIWSMVEFSRAYLSKGHTSVMWKDTAFNYSYFLWFEDQNGTSIKPKELQNQFAVSTTTKQQYEPGILAGDYYQRLCETNFPKIAPTKIKCFELYCIHLGLVTGTCALEHSRRLVATINDVGINPSLEFS